MIKATFYKDTIPICFVSNEYFVPYMAAMIQSIMEHANPNRYYSFFVIHREITSETMKKLDTQISQFNNFRIDYIDVSQIVKGYNFFIESNANITAETYFKLLIPYILYDYEKVIYFDSDMICEADISCLYDIDIGDNLISASHDHNLINKFHCNGENNEYYSQIAKMENCDNYINAGFVIINIKEFAKKININEMFELITSRKWQFQDQDILNYISEGRIYYLPSEWDFIPQVNVSYLTYDLRKEYQNGRDNHKIIHYAGNKPWDKYFLIPYFELFWKYATRTPFTKIIIQRLKDNNLISSRAELLEVYKVKVYDEFINNIRLRRTKGLRTILFDILTAWLMREKQKI